MAQTPQGAEAALAAILPLEVFVSHGARAEIPLRDFFAGDRHQHCAEGRVFPLLDRLIGQAPCNIINGFLIPYFIKERFYIIGRKLGINLVVALG